MYYTLLGAFSGLIGYPLYILCNFLIWILVSLFTWKRHGFKPSFNLLLELVHPMRFKSFLLQTLQEYE